MTVSCESFAYIAIVLFMTSALNLLGIAILRYLLLRKLPTKLPYIVTYDIFEQNAQLFIILIDVAMSFSHRR